jgi:DNA polymerase-1
MPDDLVNQLPRIYEAVKAFNIHSCRMPGFEADDIIGTLAVEGAKKGYDVWCVTSDKDYFQLVNDRIKIYRPKSGNEEPERFGREEVKEKFGVYPEQVIDKLALMGDSSDNVPGIRGIGPKTADKLLEQFGSLEAILDGFANISAKGVREKVSEGIESAKLSKTLVTIHTEVPVEFDTEAMKASPYDYEALKTLFVELEFNRLLQQLLPAKETAGIPPGPPIKKSPKENYQQITSVSELKTLITWINRVGSVAIDTETTSIDSLMADLVGISLCCEDGEAYYLPVGHTSDPDQNLDFDKVKPIIEKLLNDPRVKKFGQNIKYDLQVFHRAGLDIGPIAFDTMLAAYLIDSGARQNSLDDLALKHFQYQMQPITDLIGSGKNQRSFAEVPVKQAVFYAAEDADYTWRLHDVLAPQIEQAELQTVFYDIEMPLVRVLSDMEEAGVKVDVDYLGELSESMDDRLHDLRKEIYKVARGEFNINSTQQLSHILFDKLMLPTQGKTAKKTGFSTDQSVLEELARVHPFPQLILDYRQLTKLQSTYVDAIGKLINPETGRVHTSFNQTIAATGRLSSTNPNLQNIPIRTEEGRQIRKAFVPREDGYILLAADYSQIELRLMAHVTDDQSFIEAFKKGEDIHRRTAAEVFGVPLDEVDADMRRVAKTANFAVIYGVTAFGLSQQTEMNVTEAQDFINTYFERYPGITKYMEETKEFARQHGYVATMYGRRRYLNEINDKNRQRRMFAERMAINSPIQGAAADIIKLAMIQIHKEMLGMKSKMILQVHDELVFDIKKSELEKVKGIVRDGMEKVAKLKVPLVADIGVGENWLECK